MSEIETRLKAARDSGDPAAIGESIPLARWMGFSVGKDDTGILARLTFTDMLIGNPRLPAIHGGAIGAFLEMTALAHLMWEIEEPAIPKTINITIEYLRSGKPQDMFARATITKHGRRVANVSVVAWQGDPDKPVATAHGHFLLPDPPAAA